MRYLMKQKLLSFGDDFVIEDDAGNKVFYVDGRAFSIGDKLSFQDMQGNELAFISQKLLAWGKTYTIYRGGDVAAVVGACSLQGGSGTITGTVLGVLFLRTVLDAVAKIIDKGADLYEGMIVGVVVILAVAVSRLRRT